MRIATASLVRAPLDKLIEWVAYHLNVGIDDMHLFFDDPDDPALAVFTGHPQVHCYRCDDQFWADHPAPGLTTPPSIVPDKQAALLAHLLQQDDPGWDWLAHIDSDELIWAPGDLRRALERELSAGVDHVQLPPLEAVVPRLRMKDAFREVTLFKEHRKERYMIARLLGVRRPFKKGVYLRGHRQGKADRARAAPSRPCGCTARRPRPCGPQGEPHKCRATSGCSITTQAVSPSGSTSGTTERPMPAGSRGPVGARPTGSGASRGPAPGRGRRRLKRLYRREYMLTAREARVLRSLGLLHKITLDQRLFELRPVGREVTQPHRV